jgi:hypothetical protein
MKLFDRVIELKVGETDITGLDIAFDIEKDLSPEPNPCHVEIYNLGAHNRSILSKYSRVPVLLKVGFKDHVGVIFRGDMMSCTHEKKGPTWKTILASGDGAMAIQRARINKSFAKGTPVKDIIKEIAKQLNLPCDGALKQLEFLSQKLARGFCVHGSAMDELSRILNQHGLGVSIQNNSLQLLKQGEVLAGKAINLTTDSGLKGSPHMGSDKMLHVKAVLMPELLPGTQVQIQSLIFNGFATVQNVRFCGANFGDEWGAELKVYLPK